MVGSSTIFLALILPATPLPVPLEERPEFQCNAYYMHVGGVNRTGSLHVSGPKEKTWSYSMTTHGVLWGDVSMTGSYELVDDLAIFTGKTDKGVEVRFGLNYSFIGDKLVFDNYFPFHKTLNYHRQWFEKVEGEWKLIEELKLSIPMVPCKEDKGRWETELEGERRFWDKGGKPTSEPITRKLTYQKRAEQSDYERVAVSEDNIRLPSLLPIVGVRLEPKDLGELANIGGPLRGFSPRIGPSRSVR